MELFYAETLKHIKDILKFQKETKLLVKECQAPDLGGLYSCAAAIMALVLTIFPALVFLRNSLTSFMRKMQTNQTAANIRRAQRHEIRENPEGSVEEQ